MKIYTVYETSDGKTFTDEPMAKAHETAMANLGEKSFNRYMQTYGGKSLMEKHRLNEVGVWAVYGEDPNPDMGGSHHEPHLATFSGTLETVIRKAVMMDSFWAWGGGGRIKKARITEV